jgi:hypothetical protein
MYVSAPFFLILPWYPTHLRASRRFSGSLSLYRQAGLRLVGGRPGWDPIVLQKPGEGVPAVRSPVASAAIRATRVFWLPGRFAAWPYVGLHLVRKAMNRRFA